MRALKQTITAYFILAALVFGLFNFPLNKGVLATQSFQQSQEANVVTVVPASQTPNVVMAPVSTSIACGTSSTSTESVLDISLGLSTAVTNFLNNPATCFSLVPGKVLTQNTLPLALVPTLPAVTVKTEQPSSLSFNFSPFVPAPQPAALVGLVVFSAALFTSRRRKIFSALKRVTEDLSHFNVPTLSELQMLRC